jgi:hypothetical protein
MKLQSELQEDSLENKRFSQDTNHSMEVPQDQLMQLEISDVNSVKLESVALLNSLIFKLSNSNGEIVNKTLLPITLLI